MALSKMPEPIRADSQISAYGTARSTIVGAPLTADELRRIDAYWLGGKKA